MLSAFSQRLGVVLRQVAVEDKSSEISAMTELLANLVLHGRLITGDALLTQREIARAIVEHEGDYLLVVKDNQPLLRQDIQALSEAPHSELLELGLTQQELSSERSACQVSMHGSRIEQRVLRASTAFCGSYRDRHGQDLWPGLAQVMQIKRTIPRKEQDEAAVKLPMQSPHCQWSELPQPSYCKRGENTGISRPGYSG